MKRKNNLYPTLISDDNLKCALFAVNMTHRWHSHHKPNKVVKWVESDISSRVEELRTIIEKGFVPASYTEKKVYDKSACKWREIHEPKLWPDQYVHHALIQVLQPVMMRGMDKWCCGSIKGRGTHYGIRAMQKWMYQDIKGTKYCVELDIHHFYQNLTSDIVMKRLRSLVKDYKVLDLVERITNDGILIGCYCSQWFANTVLQPLDHKIRENGFRVSHYLRYMDNFTIFSPNKGQLKRLVKFITSWLTKKGLELNKNWQIFSTEHRMPKALGYRYSHSYTLLRKENLLRLKRSLNKYYKKKAAHKEVTNALAAGILSRLGQLKYCNSTNIYHRYVRPGTQRELKQIVRDYMRKETLKWNTLLA